MNNIYVIWLHSFYEGKWEIFDIYRSQERAKEALKKAEVLEAHSNDSFYLEEREVK
jgi:hypothetical protein